MPRLRVRSAAVSTLIKLMDKFIRYEESDRKSLVRLFELCALVQEDVKIVLAQEQFRCPCGSSELPVKDQRSWDDFHSCCPACGRDPSSPDQTT